MSFWTDEIKERAKHLWLVEKLTALQIGQDIGCTRNAVIGQLHRMGLCRSGRLSPAEQKARDSAGASNRAKLSQRAKQASTIARRAKGELAPLVAKVPLPNLAGINFDQPPRNVTIDQLRPISCRWVTNDVHPATYCDHDVKDDTSWCPFHHAIVYRRDLGEIARMQFLRDKKRDRSVFGALRVA